MEKFSCDDHVVAEKIKMTNQKSFLNSFRMVILCDFFMVLALALVVTRVGTLSLIVFQSISYGC